MSGRASSVRLRSALGKIDQADNTSIFNSTNPSSVTTITEKSSRSSRRTNGHHSLVNGGYNNNNGNGSTSTTSSSITSTPTATSTRSQSRTRGNSSSGSGVSAMEIDGDENVNGGGATVGSSGDDSVTATGGATDSETTIVNNATSASDSKTNNGNTGTSSSGSSSSAKGGGGSSEVPCSGNANNNNNNSSNVNVNNNETSKTAANCSTTAGTESNSMEVDESSSDSSSSDSSDSSDSEDSSEMDEQSSEVRKQAYQTDLNDLEKQFTYLRELLYQQRMTLVTSKLEEVRSGKAKEYLGPLLQLQENMRIRMEVTANLRQFRLVNVQHKFDAEGLAIRQNYDSEKQIAYDKIKSDLEEKIRRLEEDRNNDFTSELWLETALKKKNKKSIDLFGDKKKKQVTVSGPYLVYMLNDVDIVEDWTVVKKALATPKRKHVEMVY